MAMSGLETLFANLGPATAGAFAGEREALAQKEQTLANLMEQEKINQQRLESSRYGQETPLLLEESSLKNRGLQEGLPGITAKSRVATTEADEAAAMSTSKVALGLEKNKTELTGEHIKQLGQFGQTLQTIAPLLQSAPAATHHAIMQQALEQAGLSQDPHMQTMAATIGKLPAAQVGPAIQKMTDWINTNTAAYVQAIATGNIQKQSHLAGITAQGANQQKIEQMGIDAGKYAHRGVGGAVDVEGTILKAKTPIAKAEVLEQAYYVALQAGNQELAASYKARAAEARQRAAEDAGNKNAPGGVGASVNDGKVELGNKPRPTSNAPIAGSGKQLSVEDMRKALKGQ